MSLGQITAQVFLHIGKCPKTTRNLRRISGSKAETLIERLSNTNLERYRFTNVLGNSIWKCLVVNYPVQLDGQGQSQLVPSYRK
jgi:hypothetical protein